MARVLLIKGVFESGLNYVMTYPLGLMYLASVLRERKQASEVSIYDMRLRGSDPSGIAKEVARFKPDVVGISGITVEAASIGAAAKAVRAAGFNGSVVVGGPHASAFPDRVLEDEEIDVAVLGEGEETFSEIVRVAGEGRGMEEIQGIAYKKNGDLLTTKARPFIDELDSMPFPAWDLVDIEEYSKKDSMAPSRVQRYMNLYTSRACPFKCIYCHNIFGKGFRARSAERVFDEIEFLYRSYGLTNFEILDDIFNFHLPRAKEVLSRLESLNVGISLSFPNGLRCDRLDRDFLTQLSRLGMAQISVAVESASPRIQKLIRKNLNLEKVGEVIKTADELGIFTRGFFMIGFPTETEAEMRETIRFASQSRLHTAMFFNVIPFEGTELFGLCKKQLEKKNFSFKDYDYFKSPINLSEADDGVFFSLQKRAYLSFYVRPRRLWRIFRVFPHKHKLIRHFLATVERLVFSGKGNKSVFGIRNKLAKMLR